MKESYGKGLATRLGPESCAGHGNMAGEALTGVHAGQPLSSEIISPACRPCSVRGKATLLGNVARKSLINAAESKTLSMCGNSLHGNRETLETPVSQDAGRSDKAYGRTSDMHVFRESDGPIVPQKRANKDGSSSAESVEGRGPTKGNAQRTLLSPDSEPEQSGIGAPDEREVFDDSLLPEVRAV